MKKCLFCYFENNSFYNKNQVFLFENSSKKFCNIPVNLRYNRFLTKIKFSLKNHFNLMKKIKNMINRIIYIPIICLALLAQVHAHAYSLPTLNEVSGMVPPSKNPRFVRLPNSIAHKTEFLQKNVAHDLQRMVIAAQKDGVRLRVISGFRSFEHQKSIWQRKWHTFTGEKNDTARVRRILRYSTPPAFSRHHWGTDVDLNSLKLAYWASADGRKTLDWLRKNAHRFGFCEVYSGNRTSGHTSEMWHWSHIASARPYYLVRLANLNQAGKLTGLSGSHVLTPALLRPYVTSLKNCF